MPHPQNCKGRREGGISNECLICTCTHPQNPKRFFSAGFCTQELFRDQSWMSHLHRPYYDLRLDLMFGEAFSKNCSCMLTALWNDGSGLFDQLWAFLFKWQCKH